MIKFYDTSSLLTPNPDLFNEHFVISSITLEELENIKTSSTKSEEIKYQGRHLLQTLDSNPDKFTVVLFTEKMLKEFKKFPINNDIKIIACALDYNKKNGEIVFVTNDLAQKHLANLWLKNVSSVKEKEDKYTGFKEVFLTDEEMEKFYNNLKINQFGLYTNQYLIIRDINGEIVDKLCWTGEEHRPIVYGNFKSKWFGEIKPLKGDLYQILACDSLINNRLTLLKGPAGSGKTLLSLGYLFHKLDRGQIDKIIVFCNTIATKNSAKLGFYPGSRNEKLLDSQIGNLLSCKLGSKLELERLISEEKIVLLPFSDIRGYDTTGMRAGIYISEAQNLDIPLMKLALQRIGEDSICIIDGDCKTQVDDINFAGLNNGMKRASKVFRGAGIYGEIELQNIYRSRIAQIAEQL